jgi:type I restriction enzyme R subunit
VPNRATGGFVSNAPKELRRLNAHYGAAVRERFVRRLASEIERRGALDVLRNGIRDSGVKFQLAYFRPSSGLNEETQRLHAGNLFAVVRQLRYSTKSEKSLDLVLFLNGIPIFTAELKNPLTGQEVENAIRQYKTDRDTREPLFGCRCLVHFAVDPELVYVTTQLAGPKRASPFNRGDSAGLATRRCSDADGVCHRLSLRRPDARHVLDLVRHHPRGPGRGHRGARPASASDVPALPAARLRAAAHGRRPRLGAGQRYLISTPPAAAGLTIAWLAHRLATCTMPRIGVSSGFNRRRYRPAGCSIASCRRRCASS